MPEMTWDDSYSVGVEQIDNEHKQLIALINEAHNAVFGDEGENDVAILISNMKEYASNHFASEEALMTKYSYPDACEHRALHEQFKIKAQILDSMVSGGDNAPNPLDVFQFLSLWLIDHILKADKKFGDFLISKEVC